MEKLRKGMSILSILAADSTRLIVLQAKTRGGSMLRQLASLVIPFLYVTIGKITTMFRISAKLAF